MKKNKFSKALKHLKSKKLDEKIKKLEEAAPTNSMSGVYQVNPRADAAFRLGELDPPKRFVAAADGSWPAGIPGTPGEPYYDRPAGYFKGTVDWETITEPKFGYNAAQGNSTDGLIDPVTNVVKTQLPPNSRSFILGPLVDGFVPNHISDAFTRIGYIEKDTRQFVLLASFTGEWISGLNGYAGVPTWNGTSTGFTQVNPNFTLDMALWFRNEMLKGRYVKNVSYNAVGGIPQPQFSDPNAPQPLGGNGVGGGSGAAGDNPDGTGTGVGSGGEPNAGTPQGDPDPGKDPGQNDLWGMSGRRRRKNRRGSGARGNRGRKKPDPTPSPTPDPQGGRGGGTGNPTNRRGSGARGNRGSGSTPSPTPTGGRTPDPQGGRGGGTGNPTNQRGSGARGNRGSGSTPSPTPTGGFTPTPQGGRGGGQGNPTNQRGSGAGSAPSWASQTANNISNSLRNSVPAAVGRAIRSLTDPFRYAGSLMFQGNPAGRAPGLSNYWSPNPVTAGGYTGKGGGFPGKGPTASGTITSAPRPTNTPRVSRSPLGQPQFKFPKGSGGVRGMVTQTADNAAVSALGRRAASTLGRRLGRVVPFVGAGIAVADATSRIRNGDYGGAILSGLSAIPGPLGWIALGTQMVTDGFGATGNRREEYIIETKTKDTFKDDLQNMGGFDIEKGDWGAAFMDELAKSTEIEDDEKAIIAAVFSGEDEGLMITDLQEVLGKIMARIANKEFEGKKPEVQESYTASKKRILREISQPLKEIKELPKTTKLKGYKPNFKGKYTPQNTPDVTSSKKSDRLVMAKNAEGQLWSVGDKYFKGWETTNRMNHVYSRVGESDKFFEQITANNSADVERKMQEHLNHVYHNKAMLQIDSNYVSPFSDNIDEQETYDNKINDPLFTKVAKRLKKEIDYEKKPAKAGYPNEAPPKVDPNTGMHPKYGKRYKYDKLDPQSAEGMPMQDDPEIDANIQKATDQKAKARKLKNLLGKK